MDLTYTALGHFYPQTKKMIADLRIAPEDPANRYSFTKFDITKTRSGSKINAIFCHITKEKNDNGTEFRSTTYNHILTIEIDKLNEHPVGKNSQFDFGIDYSLLIIFHDNVYKIEDVEKVYNNLEEVKMLVDSAPDGCTHVEIDRLGVGQPLVTPRILGVSIIRK